MPPVPPDTGRPPVPRAAKRIAFRLAALLVGLAPFVLFEACCLLFGWGRPADVEDPYVGFRDRQPLFVLNDSGTQYEIPPARLRFFRPESFPVFKFDGEFRIFVLGGSTVAGEPFSSETSFTTWLDHALKAADPGRRWRVVNCGGISYASYRLAPILEECLAYQPDLFVLCTGHNEFLEDRTYHDLKGPETWRQASLRGLRRLRTVTLAREAFDWFKSQRAGETADPPSLLPGEVNARLDHSNGLAAYHRDRQWADGVTQHFRLNRQRMVKTAANAGIPMLLVQEPSNLADCPPFKSEHRAPISNFEKLSFDRLLESSRELLHTDPRQAAYKLQVALRLDGEHALTWYELGTCLERMGDFEGARNAFLKARDLDICPLRITSPLESVLRDVARDAELPLVNAHQLLERRSKTGILGDFWLVDHVHPSISGHQAIAEELLEEMVRAGHIQLRPGSDVRRKAAFARHLDGLPPIYYERGRRTLELLEGWARGRAEGAESD